MSAPAYEAYALRYAAREGQKRDDFHRYDFYGEPDESQGTDYYFWLMRSSDHVALVDCGFDEQAAQAQGRTFDSHPLDLLGRLGVDPGDVDHVVISHMHYDHIGNVDLFPRATFSLAREEYDFWTTSRSRRFLFTHAGPDSAVDKVRALVHDGRVELLEGGAEVLPGIVVTPVGGHTPGTAITAVNGTSGTVVLASDAAHFYEEYEAQRPYNLFSDLEKLYDTYDVLRSESERPGTVVVPGHDPRTRTEFVEVETDCWDLNQPIGR